MVQTNREEMVATLRAHWKSVFSARGHDSGALRAWVDQEKASRDAARPLLGLPSGLKLRRRHIKRAVKLTGNTAPGPDGIPFKVWRLFGDLAVDLLFDAFKGLIAEDALQELETLGFEFNESLLHLLPKKAVGTTVDGIAVYSAGATRPLNVVNTDNRIIASAVRLMLEPAVSPNITGDQRGFLHGRSMLANVVDVEEAMCEGALSGQGSLAFFMDFEAAFPSVEHGFLIDLFTAAGWPAWLLRYLRVLYHHNVCMIAFCGALFEGFVATRGVRQGCPLSPLLLAASSDLLLERIGRLCGAFRRAYADDTAVILRDGLPSVRMLGDIFEEFARISGLGLNISKTVVVPLFVVDAPDLRAAIASRVPGWGQIGIEDHARYLGFEVGPGRGDLSWSAPLRKYRERVEIWRAIGAGLRLTVVAYRVYILSVLLFVAQLERVPEAALQAESRALLRLTPGPTDWMTAGPLKALTDFGMNFEFASLSACATAAAARAFKFENYVNGGLRARERRQQLSNRFFHSDGLALSMVPWARSGSLFRLVDAAEELAAAEQARGLDATILGVDASDEGERRSWQRRAVVILRPLGSASLALAHARRRLDKWVIPLLPARRPARMIAVCQLITARGTPRISAAFIRTAFHGWCTARRFQGRARCLLGCGRGEDSIQHYCCCAVYHRFCFRHAGLVAPAAEQKLECFLNLGQSTMNRTEVNTPEGATLLRALSVYAAYRVQASVRNGALPAGDAADALPLMLREGARGHPALESLLRSTRRRARSP